MMSWVKAKEGSAESESNGFKNHQWVKGRCFMGCMVEVGFNLLGSCPLVS